VEDIFSQDFLVRIWNSLHMVIAAGHQTGSICQFHLSSGRHYLTMVAVPAHRKALTRLLLSDHTLSVERLRLQYPTRYRLAIPREHRLCRFCEGDVEDEVHALLDCDTHALLADLRCSFLADVFQCDADMEMAYSQLSSYEFLRRLSSSRKAVTRFAKYVCEVFYVFDKFQRYVAPGYNAP